MTKKSVCLFTNGNCDVHAFFPETLKTLKNEKSRQNAENKQTFDLSVEIEIEGKTRQNAENKQTFSISL